MGVLTTGCNQPLSILIARSMLSKRPVPQQAPHTYQVAYAETTLGLETLGSQIHRFGELKRVRGGAAIRRESDVGAAPALPIVAQ
jgi:hypothetical protein